MQYRIVCDPQIELSLEEFVSNWNKSQYSRDTQSIARLNSDGASDIKFLSPEMSTILISAAVSIPAAVIANLVSEYLKEKFLKKESPGISVIVFRK